MKKIGVKILLNIFSFTFLFLYTTLINFEIVLPYALEPL
jgi:hypothetical protein